MAFSANRLTLYAIINALEEDLRIAISNFLPSTLSPELVLGSELFSLAIDRYQKENGENSYIENFVDLLIFIDFPDAYQVLQRNSEYLPPDWAAEFKKLVPSLEKIVPIRNRVAHGRPLNFDDLPLCLDVVERIQNRIDCKWPSLQEIQEKLASNPGCVLELNLPTPPKDRISHNLPIPDFDETGFMGRVEQTRSLRMMLNGPYPVISIIGEGGLGKSALALKMGYELLDDESASFDAIVWSSAKANTVTGQEIRKIEQAVTNSLGMFRNVSEDLVGTASSADCIEEILSYLEEFKILLILDNLETVMDGDLINFFDRLPAGSKVMTTSRIGLGEFERRLNLSPMSNSEGARLMRAVSKARGVKQLSETPQPRLNNYSNKLKNNPGFIKWFVSSVQSGVRPEKVIQSTGVFLDFCLENVYGYLNNDSRRVLSAMQVVSRSLSIPEISYLTGIEPIRLQQAIHQLLQTNMLVMSSSGNELSSETRYGLAELSRSYLVKKHTVNSETYHRIKGKERELSEMYGDISGGFRSDESSVYKIAVRSRSDTVIAGYLMQALKSQQGNEPEEAILLVEKAKELSPGFHEVHRVDAWINAQQGSFLAAKNAYEAACELAPQNAQLLIWYSGFLQRCDNDLDAALLVLTKALSLEPNNAQAKLEHARILVHMGKFDLARQDLIQIEGGISRMSKRITKIYWDLLLQISSRKAERLSQISDDKGVLDTVETYFSDFERVPRDCLDFKQMKRICSIGSCLKRASRKLFDSELRGRAQELISRANLEIKFLGGTISSDSENREMEHGESYDGIIETLHEKFGFIRSQSFDENIYFNRNEFLNYDISKLKVGTPVTFHIGQNNKGNCAVGCTYRKQSDG